MDAHAEQRLNARKPAFRGVECGADRRAAWTQWERRVQGTAEHMLRTGIGPAQYEDSLRRMEHCVICGRWWKLYAASSHLTIWTELPEWVVWLLRHKTWKTMHNQQRKESK